MYVPRSTVANSGWLPAIEVNVGDNNFVLGRAHSALRISAPLEMYKVPAQQLARCNTVDKKSRHKSAIYYWELEELALMLACACVCDVCSLSDQLSENN
jgi:hypothetical protein